MTANLTQSQWISSGWTGAPGYMSFYYGTVDPTSLATNFTAERTLLSAIAFSFASNTTFTPVGTWRQVDAATGDLEGVVANGGTLTGISGSGANTVSAPAGYSVNWLTLTPAASRLVTGRTYFVPASTVMFEADGTLHNSNKGTLQTAFNTFVASVDPLFCIWRRPVAGTGGSVAPVVGARLNDRVSILRSRRA